MVKINIDISNRSFIFIGIFLIIFIGGGFVIAYNTNPANPAVMGHSTNEIAAPVGCTEGQFLKYTSSGWVCGSAGGVLECVTIENSCINAKFCQADCPSGYSLTGGGHDTYYGTNLDYSTPIYYTKTYSSSCTATYWGPSGSDLWYRCDTGNSWAVYDASQLTGVLHSFARCCKII